MTTMLATSAERMLTIFRVQESSNTLQLIQVSQIACPEKTTSHLSWSPDGQFLASVNHEGSVLLWNTSTWTPSLLSEEPSKSKQILWASVNGRLWLAVGSANKILIWDIEAIAKDNAPTKQIDWGGDVLSLDMPNLVIVRKKGIFTINFVDLINMKEQNPDFPPVTILSHHFWAKGSTLLSSQGISPNNARFIEENGGVVPVKFRRPENTGFFRGFNGFQLFSSQSTRLLQGDATQQPLSGLPPLVQKTKLLSHSLFSFGSPKASKPVPDSLDSLVDSTTSLADSTNGLTDSPTKPDSPQKHGMSMAKGSI